LEQIIGVMSQEYGDIAALNNTIAGFTPISVFLFQSSRKDYNLSGNYRVVRSLSQLKIGWTRGGCVSSGNQADHTAKPLIQRFVRLHT